MRGRRVKTESNAIKKEKELVERIGRLSINLLHVALFSIRDVSVLESAVKAGEDYMAWLLTDKKTRRPKPIIIFAGNTPEFKRCCRERGINPRDAINADLPDQIAGLRADAVDDIIFYGTYRQHKYFAEICQSLRRFRIKRAITYSASAQSEET